MKVGMIGLGVMGAAMVGHLLKRGEDEVYVYDVDWEKVEDATRGGARAAANLGEMAEQAEMAIVAVATDEQMIEVVTEVANAGHEIVVVVSSTVHPEAIAEAAKIVEGTKVRLVDSPVVFGSGGARDGTLLCLCGGDEADIEFNTPAMMAFSRGVLRVGEIGHGQLAKAVNNMLHWANCVSNFEALLLAKRHGMDAQKLREVLLQCPGTNGTLETWDDTWLTWQEKDMDIVMDVAQKSGITMPLFGQVDQLVKLITHQDIQDLLYGPEATYIGRTVTGGSVKRVGE
ncbi:MAG: NAD(P)-dependent oxidoreductase [Rhodospirillaceae bacterium]